jgi:hypothetical protein
MATTTLPTRHEVLADELIDEGGRGHTPFGLYVLPSSHPAAELARSLEADVFLEVFGNTPELLAEEYAKYEDASMYLCVFDHTLRRLAGVMRVILPSSAGLKSLDDIERGWNESASTVIARSPFTVDVEGAWDIATLAVAPDYRGDNTSGLISLALYQAVAALATRHEVQSIVCILDLVVLELIQKRTQRPLVSFAGLEPANYLDSPASLPVHWDVPDHRARLALIDPSLHELFYLGLGLESVLSTPAWDVVPAALPVAG